MGSTEDWWYKTRLPELQREEEMKRREKMKESVEIGKEEEPWEAVHLELRDKDFINYNLYSSKTKGNYGWHIDQTTKQYKDMKLTCLINISTKIKIIF